MGFDSKPCGPVLYFTRAARLHKADLVEFFSPPKTPHTIPVTSCRFAIFNIYYSVSYHNELENAPGLGAVTKVAKNQ
jgi:hypothetical protein